MAELCAADGEHELLQQNLRPISERAALACALLEIVAKLDDCVDTQEVGLFSRHQGCRMRRRW